MGIRGMAVMLWVSGCGGPPADLACVENAVRCESRCWSACLDGAWGEPRCLTWSGCVVVRGGGSQCHIPAVSCEGAS